MKLFLAAEGKHPESIKKLKNFIGKELKGLKVVYIPTASNGESGWESWKGGGSITLAKSIWPDLKIVQLEEITKDQDIVKVIGKPDILWMAGGVVGYLLYWIRRTRLDKALPKILEGKTVYVGSSAGSMACAKTNYLSEIFPGEEEYGGGMIKGLGFIDFEIFPHFEEKYMDMLKKKWNKGKLYLLKNGDVITVNENKIEVLGEKLVFEN